jgi:hypothetical protein
MPVAGFLKVEDVTEELAITERQVHVLRHPGDLPAIQVGGRGVWRIERDKLEQYIAAQCDSALTELLEAGLDD